jgi:EPS-associated MarR family transcriptional regulator
MASRRGQVQEEVSFRILRVLSDNPEVSIREIAEIVGVSNGSAYYILSALMDKGFVKLSNFKSAENKKKYARLLTPRGVREKAILTARFLEKKAAEYEALREEIAELETEMEKLENVHRAARKRA